MIRRKEKIGVFAVLLASLLVYGATTVSAAEVAAPPIPYNLEGTLMLGGTTAPAGVTVKANCTYQSIVFNFTDTTDSSGVYSIDITFDDTETTGTYEGPNQAGATCTLYVGTEALLTFTATTGGGATGVTLNASASCTDGVQNQNETGVDCGGECTACYSLSVSPTSISSTILPTASTTVDLTITNNGANALGGLSVTAPTLAGGNITIAFTAPGTTLASGASTVVTLNISVANGTLDNTYTGTLTVTATNASSNGSVSVSITTYEVTIQRRRTRYMEWTILAVEGEKLCVGDPVVVSVGRQTDGKAIKKVDVDVYLGGKKVFNLLTDDDGKTSFTPTTAGAYTVTGQRTSYKDLEEVVDVVDCAPVAPTTTVEVVETTIKEVVPETTIAEVTETTVKEVVPETTIKPVATTIPVAPPVEKKGLPWTTIIIVLIVVVVIVAVLKKGGGGEAAPEPEAASEAPAEGATE